jgi:hypothetical protein
MLCRFPAKPSELKAADGSSPANTWIFLLASELPLALSDTADEEEGRT